MDDQVYATKVGVPSTTLYLDRETSAIIETIRKAAYSNGFKPGGDIIGFNQIAGLVWAIGGRSPGHTVFPCCTPNLNEYSRSALRFSSVGRLRAAFVLLDVSESDVDIRKLMAGIGVVFPEDYHKVGHAQALGRSFNLYAPRAK